MSKLSIKAMVDAYAGTLTKVWEHDRSSTIGASEVGRCLRAASFAKHAPDQADDGPDDYGARLRGDILENHLWLPAIKHAVRGTNTLTLMYAGAEQTTLSTGFLSATPDGLLLGVERDCLVHHGIADVEADCILIECKSADPRLKLLEAKPEHVFQAQVQLGLTREVTPYKPVYAVISYVDASFVSIVTEFVVKFDAAAYAAARNRARQVWAADSPADLPPEGRLEGGKECKYCKFAGACGQIEADAVPVDDHRNELPTAIVGKLAALVMQERAWRREKKDAERNLALTQDAIKQELRAAGTRAAQGRGWSISYSRTRGRRQLDKAALVAAAIEAGIDVTRFERDGADADRLTVKVTGDGDGDDDEEG
jgi:hypothetical protein